MPHDAGTHAQEIAPRHQPDQRIGAALEDRDAADVGKRHAIGQLADQFVVVADDEILSAGEIAQPLALGPSIVQRSTSARATMPITWASTSITG